MTHCRFDNNEMNLDGATTPPILNKTKKKRLNVKSPSEKKEELKNDLCEFLDYLPKVEPNKVEFFVPIITKSEGNVISVKKKKLGADGKAKYTTEHWTAAHKRHKKQKTALFWAFLEVKEFVKLPCKIKYIRYAPKTLDTFENLPMSLKYINDALCEELTGDYRPGRADGDKRITLSCDQVKSKVYGVKIIIEF